MAKVRAFPLVAMLGAVVAACGPRPIRTDPTPDRTRKPETKSGIDCDAPYPPTGELRYEIAFAPLTVPNPEGAALDEARAQLRREVCGDLDCADVMASVRPGGTGRKGDLACGMVSIRQSRIDAWMSELGDLDPLRLGLRAQATSLMAAVLQRAKTAGTPHATVGLLTDGGLAGGTRAEWIAGNIERALAESGFRVLPPPAPGDSSSTPPEVEVTGSIHELQLGLTPTLEIQLRGDLPSERIPLEPVRCGLAAVSRLVASPEPLAGKRAGPLHDAGLELAIATGRAGLLCEGDTTQITLTTDRPLHVRVFDLYAPAAGLLIFPNRSQPIDLIPAHTPTPLGGSNGFDVLLVPGTNSERYIVIAAEDPKDLGPWQDVTGQCTLSSQAVRKLVDAAREDFPALARVTESGFRVVRDGCRNPAPETTKQKLLADLAAVRACQ